MKRFGYTTLYKCNSCGTLTTEIRLQCQQCGSKWIK